MNHAERLYNTWLSSPYIDQHTKADLLAIRNSPQEIEKRFSGYLAFGTGGVRGLLGAGTNRMNRYTVRRLTQGLANFLIDLGEDAKKKGVAIAYDTRNQSPELALETACTLVANDIPAYIFESPRPTPVLSFAVRELQVQAGVVITASHNPANYNGYKVYWQDGGQIVPCLAKQIEEKVNNIHDFSELFFMELTTAEKTGKLYWIGTSIDEKYFDCLLGVRLNEQVGKRSGKTLPIVYSPLHGTGSTMVPRILHHIGFTQVTVVSEQDRPDPAFSTVEAPNPEVESAYDLAIKCAQKIGAELILATDPDCDRVGVVVRDRSGKYMLLSGNQIGVLLLHYILSVRLTNNDWPDNPTIVKTIVTSEMGSVIAERYGVKTINTLTGFKYIGEQVGVLEQTGAGTFLFGYEESNGYLYGTFVRDKDGVQASILICEMAAYHKEREMTLTDVLQKLYQEYGYYAETLESRTITRTEKISQMMEEWRVDPPAAVGPYKVTQIIDYLQLRRRDLRDGRSCTLSLPAENTLFFRLDDGAWFCIRPSGTEPKLKVYFSAKGDNEKMAQGKLDTIVNEVMKKIDQALFPD